LRRFLSVYAAGVYAFLYLPLFVLSVFSFNSSRFSVWQGFTWHWYSQVFQNEQLVNAGINSLVIAVSATAISTLVGALAAYGMWKRRSPWLMNSLYVSLLTPEIVTGISLLAFFQWIFRFLHVHLGMHTVILAHVSFSLAYVVVVVLARLRTFDPLLEEAALDLGATEWGAFRRVTLPNLLPGIAAAALLCFTVSIDDYVITSLVAGVDSETLPMVIYAMARKGVNPMVNALSAMITVGLGILIVVAERFQTEPAS
jgi:spermidine/putrescine transport system permease protein